MIANRRRGEIAAELDGQEYRLCLTLGALAELEAAYAVDDLNALVERFSSGRLSALDMIRMVGAGLRGAGYEISDDHVAKMQSRNGAAGFAAIVAELLTVAFGAAEQTQSSSNPQ
jgi:Phage tail tube protein, GTA-gp10